jgi:hypothetical protein
LIEVKTAGGGTIFLAGFLIRDASCKALQREAMRGLPGTPVALRDPCMLDLWYFFRVRTAGVATPAVRLGCWIVVP